MEITLEKIELVKDRTGVSYREAKEALEATEGNVVDAIIKIEDEINAKVGAKISDNGAKVIEKIKEYIQKGNVSRIVIKKEGEVMLNIPVTVGVVGTVLAPWITVIGSVFALGTKCEILLVKDDGSVIDLTSKLNETVDDVKEKGAETANAMRSKAAAAFNSAKEKTDKAASNVKETTGIVAENAEEIKDIIQDTAKEIKEKVAPAKSDTKAKAKNNE